MSQPDYIIALDLGTTGNRAILFDRKGQIVSQAYRELTQHYPQPGWLEHDATEIWAAVRWVLTTVLAEADIKPSQVAAVGLTVQRETCLLWDKTTGEPLHKAIVWQDRRTAPLCDRLRADGKAELIYDKTGLILDAYFSATKLNWLIDAAKRSGAGDLSNVLAGTIDSWALWNLTGGKVHATDHSNASRTMLLNIGTHQWDSELLALFGIPAHLMPEVRPSLGEFGLLDKSILGVEIPITAVLGDQQAALFAHGCDRPGLLKCTYGTGSFLVAHTGSEVVKAPQLLSTIAWSEGASNEGNGPHSAKIGYALEGAMFTSGACIQWLRDGLKIIDNAGQTDELARSVPDTNGVYFVPALSGLGAPHWDMSARGAFLGLTGGAQRAHLVRAVLESLAFQVKEVVNAVNAHSTTPINRLKVDGGACNNDFLMQFQADVLGISVERPEILDATAQGAAFAAGLATGFWDDYQTIVATRKVERVFEPQTSSDLSAHFDKWSEAVSRGKNWA
ncbi:MAG: glycerol kinase GlpK [Cyanobacteria bacterium P01_D01_bin.105]